MAQFSYALMAAGVALSFCFQVGKQFDALLVDTSVPVFDTFARDTLNVSKSYKNNLYNYI